MQRPASTSISYRCSRSAIHRIGGQGPLSTARWVSETHRAAGHSVTGFPTLPKCRIARAPSVVWYFFLGLPIRATKRHHDQRAPMGWPQRRPIATQNGRGATRLVSMEFCHRLRKLRLFVRAARPTRHQPKSAVLQPSEALNCRPRTRTAVALPDRAPLERLPGRWRSLTGVQPRPSWSPADHRNNCCQKGTAALHPEPFCCYTRLWLFLFNTPLPSLLSSPLLPFFYFVHARSNRKVFATKCLLRPFARLQISTL